MRSVDTKLNDAVKANDVAEGTEAPEYDPRLFASEMSESQRFKCAIAALKTNLLGLNGVRATQRNIKTQAQALLENRGFLANFIRGNCQLPLKKTDVELQHLSCTFMYLVKLAMAVVNMEVLPANRLVIFASDLAKYNHLTLGAVDSVLDTIKDIYARQGASKSQQRLFDKLVTRMRDEKLVRSDFESYISDGKESYDSTTVFRSDRYHPANTWQCDDDGNVVPVTCSM
ncbi:MAG: hypothetical protein P1U40_14185 [Coxiellaceae bacterium]|nr:hypothetical protein [Coxiellaceae bacterium]